MIFLVGNLLVPGSSSTNPQSRFATLCAMVEDHAFRIDHYHDWTIDWARTPDGHYYSNKAPGPMLLAYPVFWVVDKCLTFREPDRAGRDQVREARSALILQLLSFLFQVVPFTIIVLLALAWLEQCGASPPALHVSCVAMLFGNTASLFMNSYFGHAMAATCVLALGLGLLRRRYVWCGLAFGLALLADYSCAVLFPAFLAAVLIQEPRQNWLRCAGQIALGGIAPGILWSLYHIACFGGPFTLPSRFQNPEFVDTSKSAILGIFNPVPDGTALVQLLFGFRRGVLFSQPWVLLLIVVLLFRRFLLPRLAVETRAQMLPLWRFVLPGFLLLLWMNASFGRWDAGYTPGPRYLSSVFPAFGLLAGIGYAGLSVNARRLLVIAVGGAVVYWMAVYSTTVLVPTEEAMWSYTLRQLISGPSHLPLECFGILLAAFAAQLAVIMRATRPLPTSPPA